MNEGRDQSGFQPPALDQPRVDSQETQPKPGHVKATAVRFSQQQGEPSITPVPGAKGGQAAESKPKAKGFFSGVKKYLSGSSESGPKEEFRLLMLGKTGSGKSTTGNTILGEKKFASGMTFSSVTTDCDLQRVEKKGMTIEIMDCPGLYDTHKSQEEIATVIVQAVACMHPGPHAILCVIRLGRFTAEEFGVFKRLKALFDDRIAEFMVIVFTGGDDLEKDGKTLAELMKVAPKELIEVAKQCGHRCHMFNNNAKNTKPQVDRLLDEIRTMKLSHGGQPYYDCPKYATIGEGLEQEVQRRLAEVTKKDLEREQYVRQLKAKNTEATAALERMQFEIKQNEAERKRQAKERQSKEDRLIQQVKEAARIEQERFTQEREALSEENRKLKEKEFEEKRQRQEEEFQKRQRELKEQIERQNAEILRKQEQEREVERQRLQERERHRQELEEMQRQEDKAERQRQEQAYREQMTRMKEDIANNNEPGFLKWAATTVGKLITAPFRGIVKLFKK